jgi:hypothetical protein
MNPLDHGDTESEGLARAGWGLGTEVVALKGIGDCCGLNREGLGNSTRLKRGYYIGADAEICK